LKTRSECPGFSSPGGGNRSSVSRSGFRRRRGKATPPAHHQIPRAGLADLWGSGSQKRKEDLLAGRSFRLGPEGAKARGPAWLLSAGTDFAGRNSGEFRSDGRRKKRWISKSWRVARAIPANPPGRIPLPRRSPVSLQFFPR